jgi:predicted DCC family thiol-disulfide oxidoreductase YuxK
MVPTQPVLFYDGTCHLCNRLIQFILKYEKNSVLLFSSLQSKYAQQFLGNKLTTSMDTVVVYNPLEDKTLFKSEAIVYVLKAMGGIWKVNGFLVQLFPKPIANFFYDIIAQNRYSWFGKSDVCIRLDIRERVLED